MEDYEYRSRVEYVQRLNLRKHHQEIKKGVDRYFEMDYMGAAEFEFGALPHSLRLMRADDDANPWSEPRRVVVEGHKFWFVGPDTLIPTAFRFLESALNGTYEGKEQPRVRDALELEDGDSLFRLNCVGWWAITYNCHVSGPNYVPFCVFLKKEYAKNWLKGQREKRKDD